MIKIHLLACCCLANVMFSQSANYAKAPNSYIYDINLAHSQNYGGIEIPVKKAYQMWANYEYLKTNAVPTPIPAGSQSATLYWEDVPGLIQNVSIVASGNAEDSKIKVEINNAKGKGNAVVAFKVNGTIYWSWHIWVTDNPENGVVYSQGFETDSQGQPTTIQYMDRNLGAVSNNFIGNDWQKSGGLMYEWGRKDPFPPLVYKDSYFYDISGEVGVLKHKKVDPVNTIPVLERPYNEIEKNIQFSVKNPLTYILNTDASGNWFSSSRYKVAGTSPNYVTWDLWSDNAKGGNSNGNSSSATLKAESRSYELKSELDPCPNGWRVPSYYGRETQNNNLSFFGGRNWNNDDTDGAKRQVSPNVTNPSLDGIKVYPGLGMDFSQALNGERNLGKIAVSGGYVYYPNSSAPNAPVGMIFQDNNANGGLWSSTYGYDGGRIFSLISDAYRTNTSVGLHAIYNNQTNPTKAGNAVKCMRDPNLALIGNFDTQYFVSQKEGYTVGLDQPNSYIIVNETELQIPINKAFSVYNQYLSDKESLASDQLFTKVLWTTNPNLISTIQLLPNSGDARSSKIKLTFNPLQKGNAVVSIHQNSVDGPIIWSWHIWATQEDPTVAPITYVTENPLNTNSYFINPTTSKLPALKTVFMDRNLGAVSKNIDSGLANGLHFQWGRKDPLPNFPTANQQTIYVNGVGSGNGTPISYTSVSASSYQQNYTSSYSSYGSQNTVEYKKNRENIKYTVGNPLTFLYQPNFGNVYNGGNHYANDLTKVRDWISNKRGKSDGRWGHGGKKSPFDPCPQGWRVPDVSFTNLYTGSKGNSPWYRSTSNDAYGNPGVIQDQWHNVVNFYGGVVSSGGWKFTNPLYSIGDFPNDGIRGEIGEKNIDNTKSGVWTASLADLDTGFAIAMQFQGNNIQTGTGVYPQAGMGVRCAKDQNRILSEPVNLQGPSLGVQEEVSTSGGISRLEMYPNPFKDEFFIKDNNAISYEVYDFSGKLVRKGNVNNGKVNLADIQKGIYLVKITMKDGTEMSGKIIKN